MRIRRLLLLISLCLSAFMLLFTYTAGAIARFFTLTLGDNNHTLLGPVLVGFMFLTGLELSGVCKARLRKIWNVTAIALGLFAYILCITADRFYFNDYQHNFTFRTWSELISACLFPVLLPVVIFLFFRGKRKISIWLVGAGVAFIAAVFGFASTALGNRFQSESIVVGKYEGYSSYVGKHHVAPQALYSVIKTLKGPEFQPGNTLTVEYFSHDPNDPFDVFDPIDHIDRPQIGSVWIIFIPKLEKDDGMYRPYHGWKGLMPCNRPERLEYVQKKLSQSRGWLP